MSITHAIEMAGHTGESSIGNLVVPPDATLLDAIGAINRGGLAVAFVCDDHRRVLGMLTDGDVRRAILDGAALESRCLRQAMRTDFRRVDVNAGRAAVLDLMRVYEINHVPVLDAAGRLVGLHLLREFLGTRPRPNTAVLLAGGKGKRLWPLTETTPKPMLRVAGRPILERLVLHLIGSGIHHISISVNHLGHVIERHFGDGERFGCRIDYLRETKPLSTGGPLSLLPERPTDPVIVMNGDLVTQADIGRLLEFHECGQYVATFGVRPFSVEVPFGVATLEGDSLVELEEKPTLRLMINAGIYVLSPDAVAMVPKDTEFPITELFQRCLERRLPVGAHLIEDEWLDVGRHEELRTARGEL